MIVEYLLIYIFFTTFSEFFPFYKYDVGIETSNRIDKCHLKSMRIANMIRENVEVVTGYIWLFR